MPGELFARHFDDMLPGEAELRQHPLQRGRGAEGVHADHGAAAPDITLPAHDGGLLVFRPADANEVAETWRAVAALRHEPAALVLSRQALPTFDRSVLGAASGVARGAYVLAEASSGQPGVILMATGSEVQLALAARDELEADGTATRVVSMPCWELFDRQPLDYREQVLPGDVRVRVAIEQASTLGWDRYVGDGGAVVGMHTFGASAPLKQLLTKFGFTPERVADTARELLAGRAGGAGGSGR